MKIGPQFAPVITLNMSIGICKNTGGDRAFIVADLEILEWFLYKKIIWAVFVFFIKLPVNRFLC